MERHGQDIGQGQQKPAPGGHGPGLADDDAGQDGDHREHARGQREQRAEGEERQHVQDETALFQGASVMRSWTESRPWLTGGTDAAAACPRFTLICFCCGG